MKTRPLFGLGVSLIIFNGCVFHRPANIQSTPGAKTVPVLEAVTLWGYVDPEGRVAINSAFDQAGSFVNNRARAKVRGLWGFINKEGKWAIPAGFYEVLDFKEGLALARTTARSPWGYLNSKGDWAIPPQFEQAGSFSEGLAFFARNYRYGYIDSAGEWAIQPEYKAAKDFSEGLAPVENDQGWGYIDKKGHIMIGFTYASAEPFHDGIARVSLPASAAQASAPAPSESGATAENHSVYIDTQGAILFDPDARVAEDYSEGWARVYKNNQWFFADRRGEFILRNPYRAAGPFRESLAPVVPEDAVRGSGPYAQGLRVYRPEDPPNTLVAQERMPVWGYINGAGRMIIPVQFEEASPFSEGRARIRMKGRYGYIDKTGALKVPARFENGLDYSEGLAAVLWTEMRER